MTPKTQLQRLYMSLFFEFLPIILFFLAYKFCGIYVATSVAIVASGLQFGLTFWLKKHLDSLQGITFLLLLILGGATLLLHEEMFIKWKLTVTDWLFAAVFLVSHILDKPLIAALMQKKVDLPHVIWKKLNLSWILFWFSMGCINLYVIYHFDTATWVNFKLFGSMSLTLLFILLQAVYVTQQNKAHNLCK